MVRRHNNRSNDYTGSAGYFQVKFSLARERLWCEAFCAERGVSSCSSGRLQGLEEGLEGAHHVRRSLEAMLHVALKSTRHIN